MNKVLTLLTIYILVSKSLLAQDETKSNKYSISAGINLFTPTLIFRNENNLRNLNAAWQVSINRVFEISSVSFIKASIGFREDVFTAERDFINMGTGTQIKRIKLGYAQFGLDYNLHKRVSTLIYFGGVGVRGSVLIYENFTSLYPFSGLSSFDFGSNLFCGIKFPLFLRRPAIQLNYYHGFLKTAKNSIRDANNNVYEDELRSRSISLLLTIDLRSNNLIKRGNL